MPLVRPNELLLLLGGFCIALLILPAGPRRTLGGVRRVGAVAFLLVLLGVSVYLHFALSPQLRRVVLVATDLNDRQGFCVWLREQQRNLFTRAKGVSFTISSLFYLTL